jgi:hypothetical protein
MYSFSRIWRTGLLIMTHLQTLADGWAVHKDPIAKACLAVTAPVVGMTLSSDFYRTHEGVVIVMTLNAPGQIRVKNNSSRSPTLRPISRQLKIRATLTCHDDMATRVEEIAARLEEMWKEIHQEWPEIAKVITHLKFDHLVKVLRELSK